MLPTYHPGDMLIGWHWLRPRVGQVVIVQRHKLVLKRIVSVDERGIWLEGDNPAASLDSRHFGFVHPSQMIARVLARVKT